MKIIISGGGTGGHVYPAIAIANELKSRGIKDILFVGAEGKLEMEKVPKAGYPIEGLKIRGFHRTRKWRNLLFPFYLIGSLLKARKIIEKFGPDIVIGVGGYASGPTLKIAQWKSIPTVIQEQNSYPGVTNKLLAKEANKIFVAYNNMKRFFSDDKLLLTGNPVRKDLLDITHLKQEAIGFFDFDLNKKTILICGGSLGARSLNLAMDSQQKKLASLENVQIIWQVGKIYYDQYKEHAIAKMKHVRVLPFIDRMDLAYAVADVIIGRAGALTLSELMLIAKPAVLVPSPNVAEDHQTKNAMSLVDAHAAVLVKDSEANDKMLDAALTLLDDQQAQKSLGANLKALAKPNATEQIVTEIMKLVKS